MGEGRPGVAIFVKAPIMGRTKTRLAKEFGAPEAMRIYRALTRDVVQALRRDERWRVVLAVTPDGARDGGFGGLWPHALDRLAQGTGDLGARMATAFRAMAPGPALIVGSDIAGMHTTDIAAAFRALREADVVLGPSHDGGYWLIGFARTRYAATLRAPIRWSSEHTLADTEAALGGLRIRRLRVLMDIDTAADYRRYAAGGTANA